MNEQTTKNAATTPVANMPAWLEANCWLVFVLPFVVFMLTGMLEPKRPDSVLTAETQSLDSVESGANAGENSQPAAGAVDDEIQYFGFYVRYGYAYPLFYAVRIAVVIATVILVFPGYREFPMRVGWQGAAVGVLGIVIWVALCHLNLEDWVLGPIDEHLLAPLGLGGVLASGERAAFNPLLFYGDRPIWLAAFLLVRFAGLALIVPVIEEMFLRGFFMRYIADPESWWKIPVGPMATKALVAGTFYGVLTHPAELVAAAVWFSLVTWLMVRTKNIWECVMAHAVTNFLLGVWVLSTGDWQLW